MANPKKATLETSSEAKDRLEPEEATFLGIPLQEKSEDEKQLTCFKEFLNTHWGLPAVVVMFRGLFAGGYPPIPVPTRWHISSRIDVAKVVWEQTQSEAFVDDAWSSIKMLLGDDIVNYEWAARVLTVLALFNVIKILAIITENAE